MPEPLARLPLTKLKAADDRRREHRHPTRTGAFVQFSSGAVIAVRLADVSPHGCCIRGNCERMAHGGIVSVGLNEHDKLDAIVRWVRDDTAGLEFLHAIAPDRREWHGLMESGF